MQISKNKKEISRFRLTPAVYLLLIKNGKILMLKRANTGFEDGKYSLPAGHLDGRESVRQAIIREAKEEVGVIVKSEDLEIVHVMHRLNDEYPYFDQGSRHSERVDFFAKAETWEGKVRNMELEKCDDLSWFSIDNLPENVINYIKQAVNCVNKKIFYSEDGWNS